MRAYPHYRDSGVEWLGEVPEHWGVRRLGMALAQVVGGGTPNTARDDYWADDEDGLPWVAISDMSQGGTIEATEKKVSPSGLREARLRPLPVGSVIYSMYASVGVVARLGIRAVTNQAIPGSCQMPCSQHGFCTGGWRRFATRFWLSHAAIHKAI